ncbi:MAG TPA: cytochrome C oxidase subunit IV family protein [Candidatus Angelobacter sp.]|nr:cytochrome C oxidase subunit IV family protein [Candidatus Angelobacter sp.]
MTTPAQQQQLTHGMGRDLVVYVCLLALAGLQFFIAYQNIDSAGMLTRMLIVACIEAGLAVLFFMHLWSEKRAFTVLVLAITIAVLLGMQYGWTDSFRMVTGAPFSK